MRDITPRVEFSAPIDAPAWTPARVRDYLLAFGGSDGDLIEIFALAILDVLSERDAFRETLHAASALAHDQRVESARLRDRYITALEDARAVRARLRVGSDDARAHEKAT